MASRRVEIKRENDAIKPKLSEECGYESRYKWRDVRNFYIEGVAQKREATLCERALNAILRGDEALYVRDNCCPLLVCSVL